ncbi:MAG: hypothetical protein IT306_24290 [Chloroflexi bacterium]|nr:hypothetical protein [Chloroflexota bacterium]
MLRSSMIGILFLALFGMTMGVVGFAQPDLTARHTLLVAASGTALASYVTWVLATRWATFRDFTTDPWFWQ